MRQLSVILLCLASITQATEIETLWQHLDTPEQRAAQASLEAAQAQYQQARFAWLPNITLSGKATWLNAPLTSTTEVPPLAPGMQPMTLEQTLKPEQFNQLTLTGDWLLYGGGKVRYRQQAASYALTGEQASQRATRLDQLPVLIERYRRAQLANEQVAIRQQAVDRLSQHLYRSEQMLAQGQLAEIDVLSVRTELVQAKQQRAQARNQAQLARLALSQFIEQPVMLASPLTRPQPPELNLTQVLSNNPNWQALEAGELAGQANAKVARAALAPDIFLFGEQQLLPDELAATEPEAAIGIGFRWSLVDRRGRTFAWTQAQAQAQQSHFRRQQVERDLGIALAQARTDLKNAMQQAEAYDQQLLLASQQRRLASQSLQAGLATVQDVTDAELNYAALALARQAELVDAHIALAKLARLAGDANLYFSALNEAN